jgi:hypothetical protein
MIWDFAWEVDLEYELVHILILNTTNTEPVFLEVAVSANAAFIVCQSPAQGGQF